MDKSSEPATSNAPGRRVEERARLDIAARVVLLEGQFACTIEDISHKGARIIAELPIKVGDQGFLQHDGLDQFFAVNWVRDGSCGLSFDRALPPDIVRSLREVADDYDNHRAERLRQFGREWVEGRTGHSIDG